MNAVVFDEAHKWSHWLYLWLMVGIVVLFEGFLLVRYARRQWFGWLSWLVFVTIWASPGVRVREHLAIRHALASGSYSVVEGTVENFHPMPHHGHSHERFEVKGIRFVYSDFMETQCFNNTTSHGGPIRAGLRVRLTYIAEPLLEHCIFRLEILPSASTQIPHDANHCKVSLRRPGRMLVGRDLQSPDCRQAVSFSSARFRAFA